MVLLKSTLFKSSFNVSGDVVQWENACLADKRSAVQVRSSPPVNLLDMVKDV